MSKSHYTPYILPLLLLLTASCSKQAYYIDTHTRQNTQGDYLIQWQVNPGSNGTVAIYASNNANQYPSEPYTVQKIAQEQYKYSGSEAEMHTYFLLVFNDHDMRVVTSRTIPTAGILNLRDIGGYMTASGEQVRWGMIYRSGDLWRSYQQDIPYLASLGLHRQYILSPSRISEELPTLGLSGLVQVYIGPDKIINFQHLIDGIYAGKETQKETEEMHRDVMLNIAFDNPNQIRMVLNELLTPSNYPILLSDDLGKDRVAFVTFLIHYMLGVSRADAISDYVLSNENLPVSRLEPKGFTQSTKVQEALTEYFKCSPNHLNEILDEINKRYGSVDKYLADFLKFSQREQDKLRAIMLY